MTDNDFEKLTAAQLEDLHKMVERVRNDARQLSNRISAEISLSESATDVSLMGLMYSLFMVANQYLKGATVEDRIERLVMMFELFTPVGVKELQAHEENKKEHENDDS